MTPVRILIVYAHPEPTSFTAALCQTAEEALGGLGHRIEVSDLYAEGFNPTAGRHDFTSAADPDRFHYQTEQAHAALHGGFAEDIAREQRRVAAADFLVFLFPLWWGGVPAILKGWFDRVLAYGFAYEDGMRYDTGFFRDRAAMLGVVTGGTPKRFSADGAYGEIEQVLWPLQRCLIEYLGLRTSEPFVAYAAPRMDDAGRAQYLDTWRRQLALAVTEYSRVLKKNADEHMHVRRSAPQISPDAVSEWR